MSASNIEWTDATWNPVRGCAKVSPGCKNCYAETMAKRIRAMQRDDRSDTRLGVYGQVLTEGGRWNGRAVTVPERLADPLSWRKPRRVFVNSMSDLFHDDVPFEFIAAVFGVMAATRRHTYQVLTKRPARMLEFFEWLHSPEATPPIDLMLEMRRGDWPLPNVWLGVSVENQATADERIPLLLQVPAAVRFLSCEPLLGSVMLRRGFFPGINWVIAGGESGPGARPCDLAWLRSIVAQTRVADVACFVKQLGARPTLGGLDPKGGDSAGGVVERIKHPKGADPSEWPEYLRVREFPEVHRG